MKLIITSKDLELEFLRLMKQYKNYYWATAWAGVSSKHFDELVKNMHKIKKIVIGIHFYQTHPDFIEKFIENQNLQLVNQPQGTFHPKVYLFHNSESSWELIIGSSNFTKEGFNNNTEANVLLSSGNNYSEDCLKQTFEIIEKSWQFSKRFSEEELKNYRIVWQNQRPKIKSLSGLYGSEDVAGKSIHEVPVTVMTWKDFIFKIHKEKSNELTERLTMIDEVQQLFNSVSHFNELDEEQRKFIAGAPSKYSKKWALFGSMKGRGDFVEQIRLGNIDISNALDSIPLKGQITQSNYNKFIENFSMAFPGKYIGVASRLLAMKRPDIFYCLTKKNKLKFCEAFKVSRSKIDYSTYWDHIVLRIYDSDWWINPTPSTKQEMKISKARAAFLDVIYYQE